MSIDIIYDITIFLIIFVKLLVFPVLLNFLFLLFNIIIIILILMLLLKLELLEKGIDRFSIKLVIRVFRIFPQFLNLIGTFIQIVYEYSPGVLVILLVFDNFIRK